MMKRQQGFTLIELIIVVAMVSIMLSIAVPSFRSFISNYRVTAAVNDFLQGVTGARAEAIKRGRRVVMVPNDASGAPSPTGSWANGWTVFVDFTTSATTGTNGNFTLDASEKTAGNFVFAHAALPTSITIADAGGGTTLTEGPNTYISFDGTGYARQVTTSAVIVGGVKITDATMSTPNIRVLCIGPLGRPRIVQNNPTYDCANG